MADEIKDDTKTVVDDGKNLDGKDQGTPVEKTDKEKAAELTAEGKATSEVKAESEKSENRIQEILDKHGYDSIEDLEEGVGTLKELKTLIGDKDAKQLLEDSEYLAKVKEYWKQQEETQKLQDESLEETAQRLKEERDALEKKLNDRDSLDAKKEAEKEEKKQAEKLIKSFNSTVLAEIDSIPELPKEYKPFLREFLGVDNPANEIDLGVKSEIKSMAKDGIKKFQTLEQLIIRRYLDGKISMPKITPTEDAPVKSEKKPQNLKEARTALFDSFGVKQ